MSKIITVPTRDIIPSQGFLKENTITYILECLKSGKQESLPPTPITRKSDLKDKYIAIDGHNLIAVYDFLGKDCEIFVAESAEDALINVNADRVALQARNDDLKDKYDSSYEPANRLSVNGLRSFSQLRRRYSEIFSEDA